MNLWLKEAGQWKMQFSQFYNLRSLQFNIELDKGGFFELTISLWKYTFSIYHNEE